MITDVQPTEPSLARWQSAVPPSLLVVIHCGFNLFVQPVGTRARANESFAIALMGVTFAQPALIAFWMTLANLRLDRRITIGLLLTVLAASSVAVGTMHNSAFAPHEAVVAAAVL